MSPRVVAPRNGAEELLSCALTANEQKPVVAGPTDTGAQAQPGSPTATGMGASMDAAQANVVRPVLIADARSIVDTVLIANTVS